MICQGVIIAKDPAVVKVIREAHAKHNSDAFNIPLPKPFGAG
jgi:hypothetical protein